MHATVESLLQNYFPITLKEMDAVGFLNRTDTKYFFDARLITELLTRLNNDYFVLDMKGVRTFPYSTTYYDTPDFHLYKAHLNGHLNRFKIRQRKYEVTGDEFFEIKLKTNRSRTEKSRFLNNEEHVLNDKANLFLQKRTHLHVDSLHVALTNKFYRITLVSRDMQARVTLDYDLSFRSDTNGVELPNLGIAEIKREGTASRPAIMKHLRELGEKPVGISKYCLGAALLYKSLKINRIKHKLIKVNKLHHGKFDITR